MIETPYSLIAPSDKTTRDSIRRSVRDYCSRLTLVPPLSLEELEAHADGILQAASLRPELKGFVTVLVGNEVWSATVAGTPFERRILLLPQCLKSSKACPAELDELGLLCQECGRCSIGTIQHEADALGYFVLVAEGTTAVTTLLARGEADAVIGVSCLHALERSFQPLMRHAVPGLAIPLLRNECIDTVVDLDWVRESLNLKTETPPPVRLDIQALRHEVASWFEPAPLRELLCPTRSATETLALDWMLQGGKRWRPLLVAGVYRALHGAHEASSETLRRLAVAVECFHKASLIHDDIEDEDEARYGEQTLHRKHGIAVALNVGDLLIGEGYRMIAESGAPAHQIQEMLATAAEGHRTLCLGQGAELLLRKSPEPIPVATVLDIFRHKTAPAFNVALQLGAIGAGADLGTRTALAGFSTSIGIAYQIRDDLDDLSADRAAGPTGFFRASVWNALLDELPADPDVPGTAGDARRRVAAEERTRQLLHHYEAEALSELRVLGQSTLKRFLYRIATLIQHPPGQPS
jgi:geranylgeranyl pyrophosphate synthase